MAQTANPHARHRIDGELELELDQADDQAEPC